MRTTTRAFIYPPVIAFCGSSKIMLFMRERWRVAKVTRAVWQATHVSTRNEYGLELLPTNCNQPCKKAFVCTFLGGLDVLFSDPFGPAAVVIVVIVGPLIWEAFEVILDAFGHCFRFFSNAEICMSSRTRFLKFCCQNLIN